MRREIINTNGLELSDQVVTIKRVSKTVKGGRTMRFTALVVVGDKNGHVGVGLGKATEIPDAIRKGREDATKHLTTIAMDEVQSVPHDYIGKFGGASVLLKRASEGTGIIALPVSFSRWQVSVTSVRSLLAPITSRMLSWLPCRL